MTTVRRRNRMISRSAAVAIAALSLFFLCLGLPAKAAGPGFSAVLSEAEGEPGDTVRLVTAYDGSQGELGAFFLRVEYDPEVFSFLRLRESAALREAYADHREERGWVLSVYTMKLPDRVIRSAVDLFTCEFKINPEAPQAPTEISVSFYDVVDPEGERLLSLDQRKTFTVLPPPSSEAALLSLTPETGTLDPPFSPGCFEYSLVLPYEQTSLTFTAETSEGAVCKVNRKNLGAGGSDTVFLLTVTAEDRKTKNVYRVTAHREEKPKPSPTPSPSPKPTPTPKPAQTPKPTSTPKPEKTPKPTAQATAAPTVTPAPTKAPEVLLVSPTPSVDPTPRAAEAAARPSTPAITIRNGERSLLPAILMAIGFALVILASDPLSKWLCAKLFKNKKK